MMKYKIFAGLGGGFNSVYQHEVIECESEEEAIEYAYEIACDEYESYGGMHGLFNEENALEENPDLDADDLDNMRAEDMENWIVYYVEPVTDENNSEEEDEDEY